MRALARGAFARCAALGVAVALPAHAGDQGTEPATRLRLGLRSGFGVPFGRYAEVRTLATFVDDEVNAIGDDTHGVVPLWVDVGYRLSPHLTLGGYFVYGFVLPKVAPASNPLSGGCPENFDCFATGLRAGIQVEYGFLTADVRPWVGFGLGYEWVNSEIEGQQFDFEIETWHSGPDLLHLQGGVDFRVHPSWALGPFVALSAMQYTSCSLTLSGAEQSCELDDAAWHGWALVGVRAALDL